MSPELSLKDLMDPKRLDMQARFNNAQIAVDMSYRLADKLIYIPEVKILNKDWKEGDEKYDKWTYVEATSTEKVSKMVEVARMLKTEIEKDLNETLKVLEVSNGAETTSTKLS